MAVIWQVSVTNFGGKSSGLVESLMKDLTCLATCLLLSAVPSLCALIQEPIRLDAGLIANVSADTLGVRAFKGIPYAASPTGSLRWRPPKEVRWTGVRDASQFSPSCMQVDPTFPSHTGIMASPYTPEFFHAGNKSEDCLYLNVWTAAKSPAERHPVIVWIHGGGFSTGSGAAPIIDGESLAQNGIVMVTFNYRVGVFGFFAHPDLTKESAQHASGNYGFLDQIALLRWVQRNIAAFGGDPDNVTIAGESAGSMSVSVLTASPLAKGLFRRAFGESGALLGTMSPQPLALAEQNGVNFATSENTASVQELRAIPAGELLKARSQYGPVLDGYVLPSDVCTIFTEGKQNDVPLVGGWNIDDVTSREKGITADTFRKRIQQKYGLQANAILQVYPARSNTEAQSSWIALARDCCYAWQEHMWLHLHQRSGKSKGYLYYFTHVPSGPAEFTIFGAFHGAQIAYSLNTLQNWNRPWTSVDLRLARTMSSYLIHFAETGDPNSDGLPFWPPFTDSVKEVMEFGDNVSVRSMPSTIQLDALDAVYGQTLNQSCFEVQLK